MSMREQRGWRSRRAFLAAGAVSVSGLLAGCSSGAGSTGNASNRSGDGATNRTGSTAAQPPTAAPTDDTAQATGGVGSNGTATSGVSGEQSGPVSVLSAGSLELAFGEGLTKAVDTDLQVESHGSATVARLVAEGQRDPDIVTLADTALFDGPLDPSWYATFASNAVVIAYNRSTTAGERLAEAGTENWYTILRDGDVRLGRTDPTQDPLGYRALLMLELASRYYDDASDLRETIPKRDQIYPETGLVSQFESGNIDAAIAYRNQAIEREYEYIDLPDRIDLSNPEYEQEWYSTVTYTAPSGKTTRGGLISYGSTIRHLNPTTVSVFETQTTGEYLDEYGFKIFESYPEFHGNPPNAVTN